MQIPENNSHINGTRAARSVTGLRLIGEVLHWDSAGDGVVYYLTDTQYNVTSTKHTSFDMTKHNLIIGVCAEGGATESDIPYLCGKGMESEPYEIKTPFDLRAVDYYELLASERGVHNYYRIVNDLDYDSVGALDGESNLFTLKKPFCGTLDGCGKKLTNINVVYDGGYFALFDFVSKGATVKNLKLVCPVISNRLQAAGCPLNASVAAVCDRNYGEISGITVTGARFTASGGEISGIATHNFGTVRDCVVDGIFVQECTGLTAQACYEAAGIVTENCKGGVVKNCSLRRLEIRGSLCTGADGGSYRNVRTAGGIVAVNRAGGIVNGCGYETLVLTDMLNNANGFNGGYEWGGIVAYNAGTIECRNDLAGVMTFNGVPVKKHIGADGGPSDDQRGITVGKNEGSVCCKRANGEEA